MPDTGTRTIRTKPFPAPPDVGTVIVRHAPAPAGPQLLTPIYGGGADGPELAAEHGVTFGLDLPTGLTDPKGDPITYRDLHTGAAAADVYLPWITVPGCAWCTCLVRHHCD